MVVSDVHINFWPQALTIVPNPCSSSYTMKTKLRTPDYSCHFVSPNEEFSQYLSRAVAVVLDVTHTHAHIYIVNLTSKYGLRGQLR